MTEDQRVGDLSTHDAMGAEPPQIRAAPPGELSRRWSERQRAVAAKMGPPQSSRGSVIWTVGKGANVWDVDGNRYVDLAAGFGSLLLGHGHLRITRAAAEQSERLLQALGDVYSADTKVLLLERLSRLYPKPNALALLGQSGSDALTAALKTALLSTGRPGVLAFRGAYHGLSYGPLAACGLRSSYRDPFLAQLNPQVAFLPYPHDHESAEETLLLAERELRQREYGAVLVEPVLGRGGCVVPPLSFLPALVEVSHRHGALLVADEVWTGLGRSGKWLWSLEACGVEADIVCLGKGLGGGLPISACIGDPDTMSAWERPEEVVHTSTFAGAPLACRAALATLEALDELSLPARAEAVGGRWLHELDETLSPLSAVNEVRGSGLMIGIELRRGPGSASAAMQRLLERGYIVSTGGGSREVIVLTPPLTIAEKLLQGAKGALFEVLRDSDP
jgi:4-aminobutyrate aminotransferase/(S)-3-amino-2-methylpropionate transaminase